MLTNLYSFIKLTKPAIMILVLAAGVTAIFMEGSMLTSPDKILLFLIGLYLTGGSANALNQCFEKKIDSTMTRTAGKRPLPLNQLKLRHALAFSIGIGLLGIAILGYFFNTITALLALGTILFYSLVYTLILKPFTSQNIVIGGIAGAMAPVGAWTASTGTMTLTAWLLFLLIFTWTPPHFWSLALYFKEDYRAARLPMYPIIKGNKKTLNIIVVYTVLLFIVSILLLTVNFGWFYLAVSIILGLIFIVRALRAKRKMEHGLIWDLFKYSIVYLFASFGALIIDSFI